MDHFGIGAGVQGAVETYLRASRRTGRTTSLVDSVKSGDRVVFLSSEHADHFKRLCKQRGIKVETDICPVNNPGRLFERGSVPEDGRLILDHCWVEEYYRRAIAVAASDIDDFQTKISGYGAAHRETAAAAREIYKWYGR